MPTYVFKNTKTGESFEEFMTISEMEQKLKDEPDLELGISAPALVDPYSIGRVRPPNQFNQLLKKIKKGNSRGLTKSTIDCGNLSEI